LKALQVNLNKLVKEYDSPSNQKVISDEIKQLEAANLKLEKQIKMAAEANNENVPSNLTSTINQSSTFNESNFSDKFSNSQIFSLTYLEENQFQSSSATTMVNNAFDNFFSPPGANQQQQQQPQLSFGIDDPFQAFDPFKDGNTNDPFKSAPIGLIDKSGDFSNDDPFSSPFDQVKNNSFIPNDDPFNVKN